mgnify:CR=1 FL=1
MEFKVGQLVICIDDSNQGNETIRLLRELLVKGNTYKIRGTNMARNGLGLYLEGVSLGVHHDGCEVAAQASRFAPLPEQRERINYVAVSETLREKSIETVITQTN